MTRTLLTPRVDIRRADERFKTTISWHAARLQPGQSVQLPEAPFLHLFVPRGEVTVEGIGAVHTGDAVRFTATGGQQVTASVPAEILLWEMHAALGG
jgi:redox-sensitive bicupin YhaK (pirin superfamily)